MNILHFLLICYFTLTLGIAGIAKIDSPKFFFHNLQERFGIPLEVSKLLSIVFPWGEIVIALLLLIAPNPYHILVTSTVLLLFFMFFLMNVRAFYSSGLDSCGCYGRALKKRGVTSSISTSMIQVILSTIMFITSFWSNTLMYIYYLLSIMIIVSLFAWLLWRTWQRLRYYKDLVGYSTEDNASNV